MILNQIPHISFHILLEKKTKKNYVFKSPLILDSYHNILQLSQISSKNPCASNILHILPNIKGLDPQVWPASDNLMSQGSMKFS
jgi:hypothetical protein